LPEAYGTGRLFFTARDSYWAFAYWDYTRAQLEEMRCAARHGELILQIHEGSSADSPVRQEISVTPPARNWFVHLGGADADYWAEFGYYEAEGRFMARARSKVTHTPTDRPSARDEARFVTIPFHLSLRELFALVKGYFLDGEELADVLYRLQQEGFRFPFDLDGAEASWSAAQEQELRKRLGADRLRRMSIGSRELAEWLRQRLAEERGGWASSPSSPFGASFGRAISRPPGMTISGGFQV
jgi:hypothetical protein